MPYNCWLESLSYTKVSSTSLSQSSNWNVSSQGKYIKDMNIIGEWNKYWVKIYFPVDGK